MYCLTEFCCVCLTRDSNLLNINKLDNDNITIKSKITFSLVSSTPLDDTIYKFICSVCLDDVKAAYRVKKLFLSNNKLVNNYNGQLKYFSGSVDTLCNTSVCLSTKDRKFVNNSLIKYKPRPKCKQNQYLRHESNIHKYKCKFCKRFFKHELHRFLHCVKNHPGKEKTSNIRKFCCYMCDNNYSPILTGYNSLRQLKYHISSIHCDEDNILCRHCPGTQFLNKNTLFKHMKYEHKSINFKCNICREYFLIKNDYDAHIEKHETQKMKNKTMSFVVCSFCDKPFLFAKHLKLHMRSHLNTKSVKLAETNANESTDVKSLIDTNEIEIKTEVICDNLDVFPIETKQELLDEVEEHSYSPNLAENPFQGTLTPEQELERIFNPEEPIKEEILTIDEISDQFVESDCFDVEITHDIEVMSTSNVFICECCDKIFFDLNDYSNHLSSHPMTV